MQGKKCELYSGMKENFELETFFAGGDPLLWDDEKFRQAIYNYVNKLLLNDFEKLVYMLYRIDVNENKLKRVLKENPEQDAARIIADFIIERQKEKLIWKNQFRTGSNIPEDEKF